MPQAAANYRSEDDAIDYTPGSAVLGGDVVVVGQVPLVATTDIAASALGALRTEGIFAVPKITGAISQMDPIYWNATGDPVSGTAGTGACNNAGIGKFMGYAAAAALSADARVDVILAGITTRGLAPAQSVAAAGSTNADATAITASAPITCVVATAVQFFLLKNTAAAILKVYPGTGAAINALTATTGAISMASLTSTIFFASSATQWWTIPLLPS